MLTKRQVGVIWIGISLAMFAAGCKKKAPPPPPPPPPAPERTEAPPPRSAPVISQFTAEPTTIEKGQSATLRWSVSDATEVSIDQGIGTVQSNGNRRVFPSESTTYTLVAKGPGGNARGTATVNVTTPPAPAPPAPKAPERTLSERLAGEVHDAYFDYDRSDMREDARGTLAANAEALKGILRDFPNATVVIEGHCDERGSAEYNLGLGDRRSTAARDYLVQLGVPADRLRTISYGKERPQCTEATESCWQQNRRAHFTTGQ